MRRWLLSCIFFIALFSGSAVKSMAQPVQCPDNIDFEFGDFTNWICGAGSATVPQTYPLPVVAPQPGRHTIVSPATSGLDPYGNFPTLCPNGSGFSVKLGNANTGAQSESISYTFTIPATATTFSILFYYAIVLQDPVTGHTPQERPRFQARIVDAVTNAPLSCVNFDFIATANIPGFISSPISPNVWYKDWTPISINLNAFIGQTLKLEFTTMDCTRGGHFGYAYMDVSPFCNGVIDGATICGNATTANLTAPYGFQTYQWFSNPTFATQIANTQILSLTPPPAVGTIFPVIVTPYTGFGCVDTLYAIISISPNPVSNAGPDALICVNQQIQIGAPPNPGLNYSWTPAGQVSNSSISNPMAWVTGTTPTQFIVLTTDIASGCFSRDTVYITGKIVDTSLSVAGRTTYCVGDANPGVLSVPNTLAAAQWYDGTTPIAGATGFTYQPTVSGNYWAQVQQNGCTDSTRTVVFTINAAPVSNAGPNASVCVNQTIQIGTAPNPAWNYTWTPASQVSNPNIANPFASVPGTSAVQFIVHTVDPLTGCNSYDTVYITGRVVDTSMALSGKTDYCTGDPAAGSLSVTNAATAIQWYNAASPIPGATLPNYLPVTTGNYWAQIQQFGCMDSTRTLAFNIHAKPVAAFTASADTGCVTKNSFLFTNTSNTSDGSSMTYLWRFSDGTTQTILDAIKTFSTTGLFTVKLITTTSFGCVDSTAWKTVRIMPNVVTNFKWDSVCINRPTLFYNLSNENGSPQVNYSWNFNNGGPLSNVKNPAPVIYTTAGQADVILMSTALGCENDPISVTKKVQVNSSKPGTRYKSITVPEGSKMFIHARDSVGQFFQWLPMTQLSNYNTRYTEFTAVNDVLYQIRISDIHTCVTVDTMNMLVLKKPGFYLPTAFTPNGDGLNDVAKPYLVGMKGLKSFSVFNRWGNRIFYTTVYGQGWDGRFDGVAQNSGVYVWILEFYDENNKVRVEKGTITLIR
jgi:gliding motility-associated-like protein